MDLEQTKSKMQDAVDHYEQELKKTRTGRAHAGILDNIKVEAYGQLMPINQVGTVAVLDAQMLIVTPFDKTNLDAISTAIRDDQTLQLNPADDGNVVRVPIPAMTEDRRLESVRLLKVQAEEAKVSLRNIRHGTLKEAKRSESDGDMSKDDVKDIENKLNDIVGEFNDKVDEMTKDKEQEVMTV